MNRKINNLEFLQEIKSKICKIIFEDHSGYYVMIHFIKYNESLEYIENYKNAVYIYLSDDLLKNDDLNDFLIQLDERYEFILNNEEISIKKIAGAFIIITGILILSFSDQINSFIEKKSHKENHE